MDEVTMKALELQAPRVCTRDVNEVRGQVLGGTIFSAFSEQDRAGIWARVQAVDDLIPSLDAFFENLNYQGVGRLHDTVGQAFARRHSVLRAF